MSFLESLMISGNEKEYEEVKKKAEDLPPVFPRKMTSWDEAQVVYKAYKLARREDALISYNPFGAMLGMLFSGLDCQAGVWDVDAEGEAIIAWQKPEGFVPENHRCVRLGACRFNSGDSYLRTSLIVDHHIHEEGAAPEWLPEDYRQGLELKKGDILLKTLNSFYLLEAKVR